ncbi:MAG: hypothetical protein KF900_10970 [Bacteroidetes bacterium]|nr:hypothetical protein [Bacteroidota bacterium]
MTQIFTQTLDFTAKTKQSPQKSGFPDFAAPSQHIIQNILSFSRNLEVKASQYVKHIELVKS